MEKSNLLKELSNKKIKAETIVELVTKNPKLIPTILQGFLSDKADIKFKSAKILSLISKEKPRLLYPLFDFFVEHLSNENNILKWNAMVVIANLTVVDSKKKFDKLFKRFYKMLYEGSLITANHVVCGSATIVKAYPRFTEKITKELLNVEKIPLPTQECRDILKGKILEAFNQYYDLIEDKKCIIDFAKKELNNSRNSTKVKAERFLEKWS